MKKALLVTESTVYKNKNGELIARGGGEVCFHNIAKALLKIGINPTVLAIQEYEDQKTQEVIDNVEYKRINIGSKSSLKLIKYLRKAIKESKDFDYVFLNQFTPHLALPWLNGRKISVIHDVYQVLGNSFWTKQYGLIKGTLGNMVEKLQLSFDRKYSDKIMTVSDFSEEKIIKCMGDRVARKIVKNPFPIDSDDYYSDLEKEDYMLFVGRFVDYKNPDHALYALKKVKGEYPKFKAVFVVPRYEKEVLERFNELTKKLELDENDIILKFNCGNEQIKMLFAHAKLFVQPSCVEGQGIVILEALASNTPVIAYDLPAYKGMLIDGQNSLLIKKGEIEKFTEACLTVLNNSDHYINNCRYILKDFSHERFLNGMKEICDFSVS